MKKGFKILASYNSGSHTKKFFFIKNFNTLSPPLIYLAIHFISFFSKDKIEPMEVNFKWNLINVSKTLFPLNINHVEGISLLESKISLSLFLRRFKIYPQARGDNLIDRISHYKHTLT